MPIFVDSNDRTRRSALEMPASLGQTLQAAAVQGFYDAPGSAIGRLLENRQLEGTGQRLDRPTAERYAQRAGVSLAIPDEGVTDAALATYIARAKERDARARIMERGPQGFIPSSLQFGAGLIAGQVDPINFTANFIPLVGLGAKFGAPGAGRILAMQAAGRAGEMGTARAFGTRLAGRAAEGAIEGAVGTAMFEPITYYANRQELQDYTAWNSLQNVRDGLLFGAGLGGGLGAIGDAWRLKQRGSFLEVDGADFGAPDALGSVAPTAAPMAERGALFGAETKILMGEATSDYRPARWAVVDADDVQATMSKADNQWRDRTRAASGEQVRRIAADPDFFRLADGPDMSVGAPTLSRDGVVIGGNGRMAGISDAYDQGTGMRYKGPLLEALNRYGIDPESIKGMEKPVLVRILKDDVDVRKAAILSNEQGAMRMSAFEQAKVDAERLGDLSLLEVSDDGSLNTAANRDLVRRWVEEFPATQRAALMDKDGLLSAEGHQRLRNAMLARALGDTPTLARLVDSADPGLRNVAAALTKTASKIADAKAGIARGELHDVDISGDLVAAVEKLNDLREKGETVADYLAQQEMFPWGTPEARALLSFLGENSRSARRMADGIGRFYDALAARGNPNQGDMFGGGTPEKMELLDAALRGASEDMSTAAAVMERVTPETAEAAHTAVVMQMASGLEPRVEAIVNADPNIGTATPADLQTDLLAMQDPATLFTSDADASAAVAARVASAPKDWGVETLDLQIGDVMATIDQMKKSAEDAFKYARSGASGAAPLTVPQVTELARASFGDSTDAMLKAGQMEIVATVADLPDLGEVPYPDAEGITVPDGRVFIVAENLRPRKNVTLEQHVRGLVLHEAGVHAGMEAMLGREMFVDVLKQTLELVKKGDELAMEARAAVPENTASYLVPEEILAYLVQHHPELDLVQRVLAAVRAWAYRTFEFARSRMELTTADLQALATAALRKVAREAEARATGGVRYSADSRASYSFEVDPSELVFREADQNRTAQVEELFPVGEGYLPIVVMGERGGPLTILDGHNRAKVAESRGDRLPVTRVSKAEYKALADAGFDDMEIAYAAHAVVGERDAADAIDQQFIGARVADAGEDAAIQLREMRSGSEGGRVRYSRSSEAPIPTPEQDLAQAEANVQKVAEYEKALRAALSAGESENARLGAMLEATGYKLNMDEAQSLLAQVDAVKAQLRGNPNQGDLLGWDVVGVAKEEAAAAARLVEQMKEAALIEKRNAALSLAAKHRNLSLANKFGNLPGRGGNVVQRLGRAVFHWQGHIEGLMASLDGSQFLREGSRRSVSLEARVLTGQWLGTLIHDVEKLGLWEHFVNDAHGPDVWQALSRISTADVEKATPDFTGLHPDAVKLAQVVAPLVKDQQIQKNAVGAWIKDLRGYVARQTHDMQKIRDAGFEAWRDKVVAWGLDVGRMVRENGGNQPPERVLRAVYDELADGKFHQAEPLENQAAFSGPANLAKKVSQHRVLHFLSPLGGYHYMREFGRGNGSLAETLMEGMRQSAREVALMKVWGPNYEANIQQVMRSIEDGLTGRDLDLFRAQKQRVLDLLHFVDGTLDAPAREMVAKVGTGLRAWQTIAKLGGAIWTSMNDIPVMASAISHAQDRSFLSGMTEAISSVLQGRPKGERREILHALGVFFDSQVAGVHSRFTSFDDMPGLTAKLMQQFFKLNGLTWWTETLRSSAALSFSAHLADVSGKGWDGLGRGMQQTLTRYRIDAGLWDLLRQAPLQAADGRKYLTPEGLRTVPDTALAGYLRGRGQDPSEAAVARLRAELGTALRSLVLDQSEYAVIEPGARTKNRLLQGTRKGTGAGEFFRFMAQFKSFTFTYLDSVLGREVYGRGYDSLGEYLKRGKGDMLGLARLAVAMTLFGYAGMTVKGLLKGQEPRDPVDPRTWLASFIQGGSAGIFGDFLFGNFSRQSRTFSATAAGPVLGMGDDVFDLFTRAREGDDVAGTAFRKALDNTPYLNLWWLRPGLNYLFLWSAQEALNPGSLRRMEAKQRRDQGVEYLVSPADSRLRPFE